MLDPSAPSSWTPEASSDSSLAEFCVGDRTLSDGEANSSWDTPADSSSDISGVFPEPVVPGVTASFLVVLLPRPERGRREVGRGGRVEGLSAAGSVMTALRSVSLAGEGFTTILLVSPRVDLLPRLGRLSDPRSHVCLEGRRVRVDEAFYSPYIHRGQESGVRNREPGAGGRQWLNTRSGFGSWDAAGEPDEGSEPARVIHAKPSASQHGEGVVLRSKDFSRLSRHPVLNEPQNHSSVSRGRLRLKRRDGRRRVDTSR